MRTHVRSLLQNLDPQCFEARLYAPQELEFITYQTGTRFTPIDIAAGWNLFSDASLIRGLAHILRENPTHLLHAHGLRAAWVGVQVARLAGIPAIFTAHNLVTELGRVQRFVLCRMGRLASRIIAVSQAVKETLIAAGLPGEKIVVIPNGISLAPFETPGSRETVRAKYGIPPDAPLVVAIGRLAPEKGFDVLLDALEHLQARFPDVHCILAGTGPEENTLRARADLQKVRVVMPGFVEDTASLLAAADVVAVPSRQEGQGIVALEAMAARKPVVASYVGGLPETILGGETGLLVPPESPQELAGALTALLTDSERRAAMGEAGRKRVEAEFTVETMVRRIEAVYREVIDAAREGQ